ncbi:unnamed protein product [Closterium sp. NIES-53]
MATTTRAPSLRISRVSSCLHHSTVSSSRLSSRLRPCPSAPLSLAPLSATVPRTPELRARFLRGSVRVSAGSSWRTAKVPSDDDDVAAAISSRTNASSLGPSGEEQGAESVGSGEIDSRGERDPWGRGEPSGEREPLGETYPRGEREQQRGNAGDWGSSSGEWRLSTGGTSSSQGLDYDFDPLSSKSGYRYNYHTGDEDPEASIDAASSYPPSPRSAIPPLPLPRTPPTPTLPRSSPPQPRQSSPPPPRSPPPPPPPPPQIPPPPRSSNPFASVSKFALAGVFLLGIGAGVSVDTVLNVEPSNVASREVIDRQTPNPDICLANGMSAMVLDQRLFISFNPFNVYASLAEVKSGCLFCVRVPLRLLFPPVPCSSPPPFPSYLCRFNVYASLAEVKSGCLFCVCVPLRLLFPPVPCSSPPPFPLPPFPSYLCRFNVYVSQAEVKPGCVLRQSNWHVLESKGLVSSDEVRDCKRNMNTFGFVGDLRESPEVSCVYHSETAENLFLEDASKSKIRIGGSQ